MHAPDRATIDEVARISGRRFEHVRSTAAGESRSTFQVTADGERMLLKLEPASRLPFYERAARVCPYLGALAYPVPLVMSVGLAGDHAFTLNSWLPGTTMAPDDPWHGTTLISLVELQAGGARTIEPPPDDWPGSVIEPVLSGGRASACWRPCATIHPRRRRC